MKENTIHLLPVLSDEMAHEKSIFGRDEYWELAETIDFIPDSLEIVKAIAGDELMILLMVNDAFFNSVVNLCGDIIDEMIKGAKECIAELLEEDPDNKAMYDLIQEINTYEDYYKRYCLSNRDSFVMDLFEYLK